MPDRPFVPLDHRSVAPAGYELDDNTNRASPPTNPRENENENPFVPYVVHSRQYTRERAAAFRRFGPSENLHAETGGRDIHQDGRVAKVDVEGPRAVIEKDSLEPRPRQGVVQFGGYGGGQNRIPSHHQGKIA